MDVLLNTLKLVHKMSTGIIKYLIIHLCFIYALLTLSNSPEGDQHRPNHVAVMSNCV